MSRFLHLICAGVVFTLLSAGVAAPARAADPIVAFLLKMLRDQIIVAAADAAVNSIRQQAAQAPGPTLPLGYLGVDADADRLRTIVDDGFAYLPRAQRDEVHAGLMRILSDPQNAGMRPLIVAEFSRKAAAMREAQRTLNNLSDAQKRSLASQARGEFARLPPHERQQVLDLLRAGHVPLPRDLSELMATELAALN